MIIRVKQDFNAYEYIWRVGEAYELSETPRGIKVEKNGYRLRLSKTVKDEFLKKFE